jgi:hypothetical protein
VSSLRAPGGLSLFAALRVSLKAVMPRGPTLAVLTTDH